MDHVEAELSRLPCVGDLSKWERRYFYRLEFSDEENTRSLKEDRMPKPTGYIRSLIEFDLREANYEEFGSGRKSYSDIPPEAGDTDDRDYRLAIGTYDLKTGKINVYHCGRNLSPP
ncbi:MAG TPA: hypothetical protein VHO04_04060 [Sphingopyxis sp.]|uniref:hypothetical protein n=1 Tax=Sphingopyxis sp. TaxID=1908224 RepID=UPI002E3461D4|nr:hypothetical protein [Sphingopyxis sp.]HEX2811838.1 hypothetical protein [Sphingopyxis sp.]